jgi:hypothetical protein
MVASGDTGVFTGTKLSDVITASTPSPSLYSAWSWLLTHLHGYDPHPPRLHVRRIAAKSAGTSINKIRIALLPFKI